ncbi:LysR substrate-binding domain-containing protein [Oricola indica]|jgi:LysR family glycine cleavage system transcriptional activator|uniref:LysR substrate-binding domain-containing protein n=1 Tax=Oricola indica TaxID=2872591 RepID=UPI001CC0871B|nr:LysR substrate-binding domain-containing protein [Oricola indica]
MNPPMQISNQLPSLALLRCFEAAAKHQSFTEAAEELGLTQGAVSRHVKELEEQIGAALFLRQGRGVGLTDAGRNLYRELTLDLGRLRQTIGNAVAAGSRKEVLSVAVLPTFGARWLIPRLTHFRSEKPDVELVVHSRTEPFNMMENSVDLAIHFGVEDWPGARLSQLCRERLAVVAAPELIDEFDLREPANLLHAPRLHLSSRPLLWDAVRQTMTVVDGSIRTGSYFDQFSLIISAAVVGLGAAILPTYLIERELQQGSLTEIISVPDTQERSYFIAIPAGEIKPLTVQFANWLRKQVSPQLG